MSDKSGTVVEQNDARVLRAFGEEVRIHLDGGRTAGELTIWTEITPPGGGPPPHYHLNEDETFHVLEGRIGFLLNGEWNEVGPGGTAFIPRGVVHTFKNVGDQPSRMLIATTPSGIEKFFARCAAEFAKPEKPDMSRLAEIGAEHGIHFVQG
ncbi:MAG TPA: cupin domain-containing protein [Candidatus Udaeobacter sp.]|nr:cupin domain-containing protein [Candidatus Udaeobacter sp.]